MKKIIALSFGLMMAVSAMAQPSLTYAKHALRAGDVHETRRVSCVEPGAAGVNVLWDFSDCQMLSDVYTESLSSANGRIVVNNNGSVNFQFDVTPYGNDFYGYKTSDHSLVYENPVLKTKYPFNFLDQHSGEYSGYIAQGAQKYVIDGVFSSEVDAYGTLMLPNGVTLNNVLRVKTIETQRQHYCNMNTYTEVKYLWYAQNFRYPVFVSIFTTNEMNGRKNERETSHISVAALTPVVAPAKPSAPVQPKVAVREVEHLIYPNPVQNEASITYTLLEDAKVSVAVYSSSSVCLAKLVDGQQQSAGGYSYSYKPQYPGIYFVRFAFGDKVYVEQLVKK